MEEKAATGKFKGDRVIWTVFFFLCIIAVFGFSFRVLRLHTLIGCFCCFFIPAAAGKNC